MTNDKENCLNHFEKTEEKELKYDTLPPVVLGSPKLSMNKLCARQTREIALRRMRRCDCGNNESILRAYRDYAIKMCKCDDNDG